MNKNNIQKLVAILQAHLDGKEIEFYSSTLNKWMTSSMNSITISTSNIDNYRIKPKLKYRPFKDAEECWQEMLKHQPFGWIKSVDDKNPEVFIHCEVVLQVDGILTDLDEIPFPYDGMYKNYTFTDGTPFGVKVEEED